MNGKFFRLVAILACVARWCKNGAGKRTSMYSLMLTNIHESVLYPLLRSSLQHICDSHSWDMEDLLTKHQASYHAEQ